MSQGATFPTPPLSVVIPAFEESSRIGPPLAKICQYIAQNHPGTEIIIVDDGSRDSTSETVEKLAPDLPCPVTLLRYEKNRGKGYALRVGFAHSSGQRVLFTDCDLSTPIEELDRLLPAIEDGADVVIGSRKMTGADIVVHQKWYRERLGKVFTFLVNIAIANVSDATCGFKLFDGDVGRKLFALGQIDDWSFDAEILFLASRQNHRIVEIPVTWRDAEGTKVRLGRDALAALTGLMRIRWLALRGVYREAASPSLDSSVEVKMLPDRLIS